ncbi:hypothetical protein ACFWFZ_03875 [Streptomyces sp. NPDC060232]|uniref:hypothetical protein n=2 Tax=unclassified Streptomyces TaxID=2593676 RepID=UPI0036644552
MQATDLTGTYTYRSFLNRPEPVDDFNDLRFAQLELRLTATSAGGVSGLLVFPAPAGVEPLAMEMAGQASGTPLAITLTGKGVAGTPIEDFHYEYEGVVLRHWPTGVGQRMTLAGTVLRAKDHGSGANLARAGQTASFLAVRRES